MQVNKVMGYNNFEYKLKLKSEPRDYWNAEFISKEIRSHPYIKRLWVCGPPKMNEIFDKTLSKELKQGYLD